MTITLTFKNKSLMNFDKLLEQASKYEYGVLNEFELTPRDLFCVMTELDSSEMKEESDKRKDYRSRFKVQGDDSANLFDFFSLKRDFIDKWFKCEYTVTFDGIPLRLVQENRKNL